MAWRPILSRPRRQSLLIRSWVVPVLLSRVIGLFSPTSGIPFILISHLLMVQFQQQWMIGLDNKQISQYNTCIYTLIRWQQWINST